MERAYSILCWVFGAILVLVGIQMYVTFFRQLMPDSPAPFGGSLPIGPTGLYFVAFSGAALVAWGGALFAAARAALRSDAGRALARGVGTATSVGLVLQALYRMAVWFMGEMAWVGDLPHTEASILLLLALAFLLLRPEKSSRVTGVIA